MAIAITNLILVLFLIGNGLLELFQTGSYLIKTLDNVFYTEKKKAAVK